MPGTKEIRSKISSVRSTQKITKAMQMVATSKMRRAQERMRLARHQEWMTVVRIRLGQMADDVAHLLGVRARLAHALLRAAHLAGGHHLHGLGDLLSALDTRDLGADFLGAGHGALCSWSAGCVAVSVGAGVSRCRSS